MLERLLQMQAHAERSHRVREPFAHLQVQEREQAGARVFVPASVVPGTDVFDRFLDDNGLRDIALSDAPDEAVTMWEAGVTDTVADYPLWMSMGEIRLRQGREGQGNHQRIALRRRP